MVNRLFPLFLVIVLVLVLFLVLMLRVEGARAGRTAGGQTGAWSRRMQPGAHERWRGRAALRADVLTSVGGRCVTKHGLQHARCGV